MSMNNNSTSNALKKRYLGEIKTYLDWTVGSGLAPLSVVLAAAFPTIANDSQGAARIREYYEVTRKEGFTTDVGIPTIDLLVTAGQSLASQGAPLPTWEALSALKGGVLGNSQTALQS